MSTVYVIGITGHLRKAPSTRLARVLTAHSVTPIKPWMLWKPDSPVFANGTLSSFTIKEIIKFFFKEGNFALSFPGRFRCLIPFGLEGIFRLLGLL